MWPDEDKREIRSTKQDSEGMWGKVLGEKTPGRGKDETDGTLIRKVLRVGISMKKGGVTSWRIKCPY